MAITTVNGALAGMQPPRRFNKGLTGPMVAGRPNSLFYLSGFPGAGVAPTPGIGGEVLTTLSGQLPFTNPISGNTYLAGFNGMSTIAGNLLLCDRLWQNSGIDVTSTSEQVFTSSAQIPARDANGTNAGVGIEAGIEVSTVTGAGTPTLTLKYTDESGNAGALGTNVVATVAASIAGTFYPIGLAAGDTGIQKAQSLTLSATWTSGTIHVILYRVLAELPLTAGNIANMLDLLTGGMVRMYDNTVPFLIFIPSTTTTSNISGRALWTQG
jgi:hypothetical protein